MKNILIATILLFALFGCNDLKDPTTPGLLVPLTADENASIPGLEINGITLHVQTYGDPTDPIIIMVHGGPGGDFRSMLSAIAYADEGYFVVFYDQRGTGLSERVSKESFGDEPIELMISDLNELINHFHLNSDQPVILIGHSWGAMLATAYINKYPEKVNGLILAEPGGLTWIQTEEYLSRSNEIKFFSEALNDAIFPEQIFAGADDHIILDYKASFFATFENAPGNTIGNEGQYPFWRNGAVSFTALIDYADEKGFDFTTDLNRFEPKVLFTYSELNEAYGLSWAQEVGAVFNNVEYEEIANSGHELLYFGWNDFYNKSLEYLNQL
ncbi:MAG: alpha/beta hydrolase [bacterium]|nr:alpha/beta hydrolase [bacterium]